MGIAHIFHDVFCGLGISDGLRFCGLVGSRKVFEVSAGNIDAGDRIGIIGYLFWIAMVERFRLFQVV
ncbi:hypothetical protein D9M72_466450 [compost metagenome]